MGRIAAAIGRDPAFAAEEGAMEPKDFTAGQWSDEALAAAVSRLGVELVPGSLGAVRANLELLAERSRVLAEALAAEDPA